ncbi:MAG: HAD family hydrolase [Actinomycetia bacterium]|nr:HAD family hydrolase [Actinomycetes bacterium]MCP4084290.1 HAD family hydrolase [Actinomycetes bacterium]
MTQPDLRSISAVVFDIGGVFTVPHPDPMSDLLAAMGFEADRSDHLRFERAHYHGVRAITEALMADEYDDDTDYESSAATWTAYDIAYFAQVGVPEHRLTEASNARATQRGQGVKGIWRHPLSENIAASARIAALLPVAVVSNNDGTAERQLVDQGVGQVGEGPLTSLAAVVDSGAIGIAKPDPAIFAPVVEALGTDPGEILYVGDTVHADVRGATAAGLPVVQLDPYDLHDDHEHWRLPGLTDLAAILS